MLEALRKVRVAIIEKYIKLQDAYLSVVEAFAHAGGDHDLKIELDSVDSEQLVDRASTEERLCGHRRRARAPVRSQGRGGQDRGDPLRRERGTPYLGLCLGIQIEVIEFARTSPDSRWRTLPSSSRTRHALT